MAILYYGLILGVVYVIGTAFYNAFLHPLARFPGPLSHRASYLPRAWHLFNGSLTFHVGDLHRKYGTVVRIAPNELAYASPQAWHDIYGHKKAGEEEFPKSDRLYKLFIDPPRHIINARRQEHGALRRQLAHGFSARTMAEQAPLIRSYVDLLIQRLRENVEKAPSVPLNMRDWLNYTTFDVIGDLAFGAPGGFGCLQQSDYHPWVRLLTDTIRENACLIALANIGFSTPIQWLGKTAASKNTQHRAVVKEKVQQRLELGAERPDFIEGLLKRKDELDLDIDRLTMNASMLVIAGSETTATLMTGALYLITRYPEVQRKLEHEIRSTFKSEDEILLNTVNELPYMLAVLNESLRRYPPLASGMLRDVPKGGATVDGDPLPEDTVVSVFQWAINHWDKYWTDPFEFRPERWLGDEKYKTDVFDAMQAFSTGPRNCIGKNLAYAEMRLIVARIIFNFDLTLDPECRDWIDGQKAYVIWHKPPLNIHFKPRVF